MPIATARAATRRTGLLNLMAIVWLLGGLIAMAVTWPAADAAAPDKAGSLLLLLAGLAMASICWIGACVLGALDDLRTGNRG